VTGNHSLGREQQQEAPARRTVGQPGCPVCGGRMWDNRGRKTNPKAPDFKCRTPDCAGRIWPGQLVEEEGADVPTADEEGSVGSIATPSPAGPLADAVRSVVETVSARTLRARVRSELRACYLDATDFVLAEVRPKYEAAGVPCTDATVAAITATLFIATCNRGAVGPDVVDRTPATGAAS
jgi:hypothetical protein